MKPQYYVGIDPGKKNGFAIWIAEEKKWHVIATLETWDVIMFIHFSEGIRKNCKIRIEDPFSWKPFGRNGSAKLQGAGQVKARFNALVEYFEAWEIPYEKVPIQRSKKSSTKKGKDMTQKEFNNLTGWKGKTSPHARDAAMMVYGF